MCDNAARSASASHGVPHDVLMAISRAETGRSKSGRLQPWPWTVNMEGAGKWFADQDEARAYVFKHFKRGARSFDVGCFQVNYKWHGAAFRSIDDMFDPKLNADYAAQFLLELYNEFGNWTAAAGAYHSRTPVHAKSYAARFEKIRNSIEPADDPEYAANTRTPDDEPLVAGDLLNGGFRKPLIGSGSARLGSLVPLLRKDESQGRAFVMMN
ncbi:transglycosylase SLT domain-containing protein [Sedimentitalea sp. JM2-8]|uniref:Transglycosylase SLT domain-containing protein n=2 Tax=Sedimentitalea xiamensis TaxID=3050037 RepID=A0ABT7F9D0_9RHOB|nr:transglycosylase SLT domain-containing protein [Sedimentitalea xiamensis]MDK3071691.1 transglycosylase SLT domain-containing protein [Sedimentitalea xiamensis]